MYLFVWDESKRINNLKKHGFDFLDAEKVFHDDYALSAPDLRHSDDRWLLIGSFNKQIVLIAYTQPEPEVYRIISMRKAEKFEANRYRIEKLRQMPGPDDPILQLIERLKRDVRDEET
jgi:uncharacterized DUF497 family protein